jgi:hypothetical protein
MTNGMHTMRGHPIHRIISLTLQGEIASVLASIHAGLARERLPSNPLLPLCEASCEISAALTQTFASGSSIVSGLCEQWVAWHICSRLLDVDEQAFVNAVYLACPPCD